MPLSKTIRTKTGALYLIALAALLAVSTSGFANVRIAFTGDQGVGSGAQAVLSLIANEGTDLLMIQGDLGYEDATADAWEANLDNALGRNFPVLTVVGNHEGDHWQRYEQLIRERVDRVNEISCSGRVGVKARCSFANIDIVQVSPGIYEVEGVPAFDDYHGYIRSSFDNSSNNRWRICAWHKNQRNLQTGNKNNSTGWDVYKACLDTGAIVALAHEHAYSRTHLLSSFENQTIVHRDREMRIAPGNSMMFVSGLGGKSIRPQIRGGDWWGAVYTRTQGATHGALFCDFGSARADCYFKAIDGSVPDRFTLILDSATGSPAVAESTSVAAVSSSGSAAPPISQGYVYSRTDKEEYRWIDNDVSGQVGNIWIDKACADSLGGPTAYGDWDDLLTRAPLLDAIAYPCDGLQQSANQDDTLNSASGYVYSRTDKNEYRWISSDGSGSVASVWIDQQCAESMGGPAAYGDWQDLMYRAPEIDAIDSPCIVRGGAANASAGFVFSRTDTQEYRWIDRHSSGQLGSIWIDRECAIQLGGPDRLGDWDMLMELAPEFDAIDSPC